MDVTTARTTASAAWARFEAALRHGLATDGAGLWDRPTRLEGWVVRDLVRHTVWGTSLEADALRLAAVGPGGRRAEGRQAEGGDEALLAAWTGARDDLLTAFDAVAARLEQEGLPTDAAPAVPMPYGDLPLPVALATFVMEAATHTSDLSDALGRPSALLPEEVGACATFLQTFWAVLAAGSTAPPAAAGTTVRLEGPTVTVAATYDGASWSAPRPPSEGDVVLRGSDSDVLLLALGRVRLADVPVTVDGDRGVAERLKELVPGP